MAIRLDSIPENPSSGPVRLDSIPDTPNKPIRLDSIPENEQEGWISKNIINPPQELVKGIARGGERLLGKLPKIGGWLARGGAYAPIVSALNKVVDKKGVYRKQLEQLDNQIIKFAEFWDEQASKGWEAPSQEVMEAKWKRPLEYVASIGGEALPLYGTAVVASITTGSPVPAMSLFGLTAAGETLYDQKAHGAGETKAQVLANIDGAWQAATSLIGTSAILDKSAKTRLAKALITGKAEMVEEVIQGMGSNFIQHFGYNAKKPEDIPDAVKEATAHVFDTFMEDLVVSGILGTIGGAASFKAPPKTASSLLEDTPEGQTPVSSDPETKLADTISEFKGSGKELLAKQEEIRRKQTGSRLKAFEETLGEGRTEEQWARAFKEMKGEKHVEILESMENRFAPQEMEYYRMKIATAENLKTGDKLYAKATFDKMMLGKVLTDNEIGLMEKVFGEEVSKALLTKQSLGKRAWKEFVEILNLPRAMQAASDLSYPGRQGWSWLPRHPKIWWKNVKRGYNILFKKSTADRVFNDLENRRISSRYYDKGKQFGLEELKTGPSAKFTERSEAYQSHIAENLPVIGDWVSRSEMAYVSASNGMRWDLWNHICSQWEGQNKVNKDYEWLAKILNSTTGRSNLGVLKEAMPILNAGFFSPQWTVGLGQSIEYLVDPRLTWGARKVLWGRTASFVGTGLAVLGLLSLVPGVKVEKDPRSSDFGKIRIGNQRIDYWAGNTQIARLIAQVMTGEMKQTDTGRIFKVDTKEAILRFLRSKLSPLGGATVNLGTGYDFLGKPVTLDEEYLNEAMASNFLPFFIQDIKDAIQYQGLAGGIVASPLAFNGIGVNTYEVTASKNSTIIKNQEAQRMFGKGWDDLGPDLQKLLKDQVPLIEESENLAKFERENFNFLSKIKEEQAAVGKRIKARLSKNVQKELEENYILFPGLSRRIGSNWFLNDSRFKSYEQITHNMSRQVLSRLVETSAYKSSSQKVKRAILLKAIDAIKSNARDKVLAGVKREDINTFMEAVQPKE